LNPGGGYLQNSNDPPYYTNLNSLFDPAEFPANFPEPRLRLRSQHSLELVQREPKMSLEDVVELKHSMRMLLADRVKEDLVKAVAGTATDPEIRNAIQWIAEWDNTVSAESRGGVLFESWWRLYESEVGEEDLFAVPWSAEDPTGTPRGLARPDMAAKAFAEAVINTMEQRGSWNVAWGEVHRVRIGDVDVPVGGGRSDLGCFRVLSFERDEDGKLVAGGGDGWILAVEFSDPPRAYSILAYGQSGREDSPHNADQAEMFAGNRMKRVLFTEEDIEARLLSRYHPGAAHGRSLR